MARPLGFCRWTVLYVLNACHCVAMWLRTACNHSLLCASSGVFFPFFLPFPTPSKQGATSWNEQKSQPVSLICIYICVCNAARMVLCTSVQHIIRLRAACSRGATRIDRAYVCSAIRARPRGMEKWRKKWIRSAERITHR